MAAVLIDLALDLGQLALESFALSVHSRLALASGHCLVDLGLLVHDPHNRLVRLIDAFVDLHAERVLILEIALGSWYARVLGEPERLLLDRPGRLEADLVSAGRRRDRAGGSRPQGHPLKHPEARMAKVGVDVVEARVAIALDRSDLRSLRVQEPDL